ncbi:MAG: restriction endonuclease subunit S [Phycisphaerales bacterium]|nr:restriction endonuclease subunit S [Phycisphaerales bacterium]
MWCDTITHGTLVASARWKVEFFEPVDERLGSSQYPQVPLGSLVVERGEALDPQSFPDHRFHYLSLENVESNTGDLVSYDPVTGTNVKSRSKVFREHDLLYGRLRPYLNKVFVSEAPVRTGICSGEFYVLTPDKRKVVPRFLREVLASRLVSSRTATRQTGSALPRLQLEDLLNVAVPLPPLHVQQRIADLSQSLANARRVLRARLSGEHPRFLDVLESALVDGTDIPDDGEIAAAVEISTIDDLDLPTSHRPSVRARATLFDYGSLGRNSSTSLA